MFATGSKIGIERLKNFLLGFEALLQRRGLTVLLLFTILYYGSYCNAGLVLTGESGSNALIAKRILEGWRPILDMFVGYNLLWFYPIAGIFRLLGPNMLAMQIFFMGICALTGVLGFILVKKCTGLAWLAMLASILMILMPGAMFRNYMGFIGTLGSLALVFGYVVSASTPVRQCLWMGFCGAALSICFLIRIEPSLLLAVVWAGLAVLYPIGVRGQFLPRLKIVCLGTGLAVIIFTIVHAPFLLHAHQRGFGREFLNQYVQFFGLFQWELKKEIQKTRESVRLDFGTPSEIKTINAGVFLPVAVVTTPARNAESEGRDGRRMRPDLKELLNWKGAPFFAMAIYFPVWISAFSIVAGGAFFLSGIMRGQEQERFLGLLIFSTFGAALSLFPQYFFFRPDSVHLAEFMVPFYPAMACSAFAGWWIFQNWKNKFSRFAGICLPVLCGIQAIVAFNALYGREGSGSIRLARGRTAMFHAPGGIDFRVKPSELKDWEALRDTLLSHSKTGDFLVTYPYVPILNIMAGLPSYQFKLYVDNATESSDFSMRAIAEFEKNKPALVVINNRDINKTEVSRFKNWAEPFYRHISQRYVLIGTYFGLIEVFVRPDRLVVESP